GFLAVLDAVGSECTAILATAESCLPVMLFAASHPDRVRSLVLWAGFARFARAPDYDEGMPASAMAEYVEAFRRVIGTGGLVDYRAPSRGDESWFREWWARGERLSAGRSYFARVLRSYLGTDVRTVLESIQAPTLILHRHDDWHVRPDMPRYLADHIPDAR